MFVFYLLRLKNEYLRSIIDMDVAKCKRNTSYLEIIIILTILATFTGSSIVFFFIAGIAVTPVRVMGMICLIYSIIDLAKKPKTQRYNVYLLTISLYIVIVSIVFSQSITQSMKLILDYLVCFAIFKMIVYSINNVHTLKKYLLTYYCGLIVTIAICIYEYLTGIHIAANYTGGSSGTVYDYLAKAPTAFLYNPNNIAVLLMLSIPFIYLLAFYFNIHFGKIISFTLLILSATVIMMTGSRGGFVACIILIVPFVFLPNIKLWQKIGIVAVCVLLFQKAQVFIMQQLEYGGMLKAGEVSIFNQGDGGRSLIAQTALDEAFKKNVIFGNGAGGVEIMTGSSAHNFGIEILSNYGILGMIFVIIGIYSLIRKVRKIKNKLIKKSMTLFIIAFFMSMFIPPTLITLHFVWVLLAFSYSFSNVERRDYI